ncbi:hypothetical protein GLOTRDRAFT_45604 [Gloeophyllum trabeum ATCC 11539]|uniref:CigA protein n=1 Tax=Gloeophyllum trabeum (strain ATCC 11539 / FP-39264 / Madison 617) TaxID=670483 RepID=S7PZ33_GLOTA|nr:uncharacterized protein GLOTRDRAFT_45604 [Gloeophyllum trabeum ATCC 11539]EPQ52906.1 hypothetical protein GLOTRDRAFT_45604 [Gloeophyllum trabeum ATCC 11539]
MGENDRFLSYLPHSGFNNQRIALENALVLSRMLNRTLLLPPARLGNKPLPYMDFEKLSHFVSLSGKERARRCASIPTSAPVPLECFDYTLVSWYSLMNLSSLQSEQSIFERWDLSAAWLERIGVTQDDIYTLAGSRLYHYRFVDSKSELSGDQKYTESVNIADLAQVPSRLIQIGTLFGSSRLRLRQPGNLALRGDIRRRMTLSNVLLHRIAADIGDAMGGVYLAAHVRVGDGVFSERQHHNARRIWWKLLSQALEFDNERISALENRLSNASWHCTGSIPVISPDPPALKVPRPALSPMPSSFRPRYSCRGSTEGLFDPRLAVPLFVSTDAPDPANHALIRPLMSTFPCTFFLSDFTSELAPLDPIQNPYDGAFLKPFLLPLIEAIIAGKARYVVGTDGSTFSAYVQDVLWRAYHDWEIVQRG